MKNVALCCIPTYPQRCGVAENACLILCLHRKEAKPLLKIERAKNTHNILSECFGIFRLFAVASAFFIGSVCVFFIATKNDSR